MATGTYVDRGRFLAVVREKVARLMQGLPGRPQEIETPDGLRLQYFGVVLEIQARDGRWESSLTVPPVLPINREYLERRIGEELGSIEA